MSPFPGTRPIHPRWAETYGAATEAAFGARVRIYTTADGDWHPGQEYEPGAETELYAGAADVTYANTVPNDPEVAGQVTVQSTVTVVIPRTAPRVAEGASVRVLSVDTNADPTLVGRRLTVRAVTAQSGTLARELSCTDDQANQDAIEPDEGP